MYYIKGGHSKALEKNELIKLQKGLKGYCPKCPNKIRLKTVTKDNGRVYHFLGCTGYPKCNWTSGRNKIY